MEKRYFIEFAFRGAGYHGWQIQSNAKSIQETMEKALTDILREEINLTGAGRTDSGVHASYFVAHFDSNHLENEQNILDKLNRYLTADISIFNILQAAPDAHARFNAISRTYKYIVIRKKQPFLNHLCYYYHGSLNLELMNEGAGIISNVSDFTSFAKLHSNNKTNVCTIMNCGWEKMSDYLVFTIKADRFLRNMVRSITGTLITLGSQKINIDDLKKIIYSRNNQNAAASAPAHGLYLSDIEYPSKFRLNNPVRSKFLPFNW